MTALLRFSVIALALTGCSYNLISVDLAKIDPPPPGDAVIFVIRPSYLSYASRDLTITANDTEIADLIKSSYTSFLMPPGKLKLSGEGGFFSWPHREINVDIKDGQTYYLAWMAQETASSALMLYLFPNLPENTLRWELISKDDAQKLLANIYYVEPDFQELPRSN